MNYRTDRRVVWTLTATTLATLVGCSEPRPQLVSRPDAPEKAVLIRNVAVVDVVAAKRVPDRDVLVRGDTIEAVGVADSIPVPPDARVINGVGATLLPGLVDSHGHLAGDSAPQWKSRLPDPAANLRAYLYCGVTTLLDPADFSGEAVERRDAIAAGELLAPTVFTAGPIVTTPGGHPVFLMDRLVPWWLRWYVKPRAVREIASVGAVAAVVDELADVGVDFLKVAVDSIPTEAPRIGNEVLHAIVAEGHRRGLRSVAHIGSLQDAVDAAEAGVDAWVHGVYKDHIPDERIAELVDYKIPMVATTTVFENYALVSMGARAATPLERETVLPDVLAAFDNIPDGGIPDVFVDYLAMLREKRQAWRENVGRLHAAGMTILAGSDTQSGVFPGAGLHRELALLVESGLSPIEALVAATIAPARFIERSENPSFGVIAVGKRADLLLVDGDPTKDIEAVSSIREVIHRGVVLERKPVGG